jgi:hypothetical protein
MATKAKTTTTKTTKAKETKVVETTPVEVQEVEKVETKIEETKNDQADEIARLQAQIDLLMKAQTAQPSVTPTTSKKSKKKLIKIINLASGGLTLQGSRAIRIPKQFDSVNVTESEARIIVSNMPESARSGLFYIADREFVEDNELEDAYNTILDDSQLKTLLSQNVENVVEIYKNASDAQKSIIDTMIADGRFNGVRIDANILQELGEVSGINFLGIDKIEEV